MLRSDNRTALQMRHVRIIPHFTKNATGSVLIEYGETKVICTVCANDGLPAFLRNVQPPQGWLTAEYSMLPGATQTRTRRERPSPSGRSAEIQRLIGRSLRGIIDLSLCPDVTFVVDCDVIQADGGTRTAAITGAYVALRIAVDKLMHRRKISQNPIKEAVAGISVGVIDGELLVDINYEEDSRVDSDMNVVYTQSGSFLEIQGTAENAPFTQEQVMGVMTAARSALEPIFDLQQQAIEGRTAEG